MSGQPMIFPFIQYSLIFNIHLYMILHLESFIAPKQVDSMYFDLGLDSSNKMAVAVAGSFCTIQPSTFPFYYIIILYFQSVALC